MPDRVFSNAIIKCRESAILGAEKLTRLLESENLNECLRLLQEFGFAEGRAVKNIDNLDELIIFEQERIIDTFHDLCASKALIEIFDARLIFHNAKAFYKSKWAPIDKAMILYPYSQNGLLEDAILSREYKKLLPELASALEHIDLKYSEAIPSPSYIDSMLDKAMYSYFLKNLIKLLNPAIIKYYRTEIELRNIFAAFRIRLNKMSVKEFKALSVEDKRLKDYSFIIENDLGVIQEKFKDTAYVHLIKVACEDLAEKRGLVEFEKKADEFLLSLAKKQKDDVHRINPLFSYVCEKMNEIQNVKIILTAKKNKLNTEQVRQRLRQG